MKELKTYISEGFFNNVGANNKVKLVIGAIKDASMNNKIDSDVKRREFIDLLTPILKDIKTLVKKGKFVFKYIRNARTCADHKITISLETTESNVARWTYSNNRGKFGKFTNRMIAFDIASDLFYEARYLCQDPKLRHSIANTIEIVEFKSS